MTKYSRNALPVVGVLRLLAGLACLAIAYGVYHHWWADSPSQVLQQWFTGPLDCVMWTLLSMLALFQGVGDLTGVRVL